MQLNYERLKSHPTNFKKLTGLTIPEFEQIANKLTVSFQKQESKKLRQGRTSHLPTLEDKLLCVFVYYRTYITHTFLGYLFNLHNSNICRLLKKIEPLLAQKITIKKDRTLTADKVVKLIVDATEQPTQRPVKKQRRSYSGKKKRHTIKTELVIEEGGKIIAVSKSHPGKVHDFSIRKKEKLLPRDCSKLADAGYQGWQQLQSNVMLPYKKSKHHPLSKAQKEHNRSLSSIRVKVEHKIRQIKVFKIMSEVYRNFQKKHHLRFNIIAGIVNLQHAF